MHSRIRVTVESRWCYLEYLLNRGKTGVTANRDKIELELNNLNLILSQSAVTPVCPMENWSHGRL